MYHLWSTATTQHLGKRSMGKHDPPVKYRVCPINLLSEKEIHLTSGVDCDKQWTFEIHCHTDSTPSIRSSLQNLRGVRRKIAPGTCLYLYFWDSTLQKGWRLGQLRVPGRWVDRVSHQRITKNIQLLGCQKP